SGICVGVEVEPPQPTIVSARQTPHSDRRCIVHLRRCADSKAQTTTMRIFRLLHLGQLHAREDATATFLRRPPPNTATPFARTSQVQARSTPPHRRGLTG